MWSVRKVNFDDWKFIHDMYIYIYIHRHKIPGIILKYCLLLCFLRWKSLSQSTTPLMSHLWVIDITMIQTYVHRYSI